MTSEGFLQIKYNYLLHVCVSRPWQIMLETLPIFLFHHPIFLNYASIDSANSDSEM